MQTFDLTFPGRMHFGEGAFEKALPKELAIAGNTVMLAYGGKSAKESGAYDAARRMLEASGKRVVDFSGISPNPTYAKVQEGAALAKAEGVDFILALGGGSVVDCCKIAAVQAMLDEDIWDYEQKQRKFPMSSLPVGAVITASGTGTEQNILAVITNDDENVKDTMIGKHPVFSILDPLLTLTVPRMQVFSGAYDTFSHAMETYFGKSDENNPTDYIALSIMRATVDNVRRLLADFDDIKARGNLMFTSAMAINGLLSAGRAIDFQAHMIEHQLGAFTDCNHGQGLAVIQPAYYRMAAKAAPEKFAKLGRVVFDVRADDDAKAAEEAVDALANYIRDCGLPSRLSELRSSIEITPDVLKRVADTTILVPTGPIQLDRNQVYEILEECM